MLNLAVLKSIGFWVTVVTAILGVLVSQHVVTEGSTLSDIFGWVLTLLGSAGAGHQVASAPKAEDAPTA